MTTKSKKLTAVRVLKELLKCNITHIIWLPDSESQFMYEAMIKQKEFTLVPVCREGEAVAIALGLILGGKNPVVLHQNTGLFEAGDSIRGIALDLHLPLLMIIGCRGWQSSAPLSDSAAIFTKPILDTWGIKSYLLEGNTDINKISLAYKEAQMTSKPAAILIGKEYT